MTPIRVFVVDDHPIFRLGVARLLESETDLRIVGEAASVAEAVERLGELEVDVVLVDLALRGENGLSLVRRLGGRRASVRMLVLSMHEEEGYAERSLRAGAHGYLTKLEAAERLADAIRDIAEGEVVISDVLARRARWKTDDDAGALLSVREREVFTMLGKGRTTQQSAELLGISVKTVESHHANIKRKLELQNMNELVRAAVLWLNERERDAV